MACAVLMGACKKNDPGNGGGDTGNSNPLINPVSGWTKVGAIPFRGLVTGFNGSHAMTPYDLAVVDNQLALLYSEDYQLTSYQATKPYKVKFTPGGTIPESTPLQRGGWSFSYLTRFIPGSFTTVCMKLEGTNYTASIYKDEQGPIAGNNTDYKTPAIRPINWYADGGLTITVPGGNKQAYVLSYTFPGTGNFKVQENVWRLDPTTWRGIDALQLSGGEVDQFLVSTDGSKVYFSVLKTDPNFVSTTGMTPSFTILARQEMPGLDAANFTSGNMIIASQVVNDKYTVLIGENTGNALFFKKVHCYQWQRGSTQFTKLYGDVSVPEDIGKNLMLRDPVGTRPLENGYGAPVKFTPDGSAYMLYNYGTYTALAIVNGQGLKVTGKYQAADQPANWYGQVGLAVCQYFDGAYYAVAYQKLETVFDKNDPRFRLEIVKLTP